MNKSICSKCDAQSLFLVIRDMLIVCLVLAWRLVWSGSPQTTLICQPRRYQTFGLSKYIDLLESKLRKASQKEQLMKSKLLNSEKVLSEKTAKLEKLKISCVSELGLSDDGWVCIAKMASWL